MVISLKGGGGGASKTGILNKIVLLKVHNNKFDSEVCNLDLGSEAVKCIAFHPSLAILAVGAGSSCLLFHLEDNRFVISYSLHGLIHPVHSLFICTVSPLTFFPRLRELFRCQSDFEGTESSEQVSSTNSRLLFIFVFIVRFYCF